MDLVQLRKYQQISMGCVVNNQSSINVGAQLKPFNSAKEDLINSHPLQKRQQVSTSEDKRHSHKEQIRVSKKPQKQKLRIQQMIQNYENRSLSDEVRKSLKNIRLQHKIENYVEAYLLLTQQMQESRRIDQAIDFLTKILQSIQDIKTKGVSFYIQDQVELRAKLIILEASQSKKQYLDHLQQLNNIYNAYVQYFFDHRISFLNNLALAIQTKERKKQSIGFLQESLDLQEKYMIVKDERLYYTKINLACSYSEIGEFGKAHKIFEDLLNELQTHRQKNLQLIKICQNNHRFYFPNK